jgi:hypothetical protein
LAKPPFDSIFYVGHIIEKTVGEGAMTKTIMKISSRHLPSVGRRRLVKAGMAGIMVIDETWFKVPESIRFEVKGTKSPFVTGKEFAPVKPVEIVGKCTAAPPPLGIGAGDWNGWGFDSDNSHYQTKPGLSAADVPKLKLKWAFGFPKDASANAQPTGTLSSKASSISSAAVGSKIQSNRAMPSPFKAFSPEMEASRLRARTSS